jgi:hypothetical protein
MFHYSEIPSSEILIIQLDLGEYQMTYHHMNLNGRELVSFFQNRIPDNDEMAYMNQWIEPLFNEYRVMNLFRNSFRNCLHQNELEVTHVEMIHIA